MKVLVKRTIHYYISKYPLAENALTAWEGEFSKLAFKNFNEIKKLFGSASIIGSNRVIFNSKGNDFRLVMSVNFGQQACYVIWFGTHEEYDKTDAETIAYDKRIDNFKKGYMNWKVLKTEKDYNRATKRLMEIFHAEPGTPEDEELALLVLLVKDYDDRHYPLPPVNVLEVIKDKMQERGMKAKDLENVIGSKGHISSVLSGRRELTLKMAKRLKEYFDLPAEIFLKA